MTNRATPTRYFTSDGDGYRPTPEARGPWSADMLHGRLLGGLAARDIEAAYAEPGWRVARLTVDLFRPAAMEPATIALSSVRRGRRIHVVDSIVTVAGHDVASVRAIVLAEGEPPPGTIWQAEPWLSPAPDSLPLMGDAPAADTPPAWEFRAVSGGVESSERSRVWTRERGLLIDDEPISPLVRAAVSGDLASPLSNGSDAGIGYINGDYTMAIARYPVGEWIGVETTTHLAADGIAVGATTMYDLDGPWGTSTATALANPLLS